jgi:hypothetical protein
MSHNVTVIRQFFNQLRPHDSFSHGTMLSPVIDVTRWSLEQAAMSASRYFDRASQLHRQRQRRYNTNQPRIVLICLHTMSKTAIVSAAPRKHPGPATGVGRGFYREPVVLPARNPGERDSGGIFQWDGFTVLVLRVQFLVRGMHKDAPGVKNLAVCEGQLVGRHKVFTRLAIRQLAKLRRACSVQDAISIQSGRKVFSTSDLRKDKRS